jgi:hypothetical protein
MPKITGGRRIELVNNVIYGWGSRAPEGNAESLNVVGNYLIPSSASSELLVWSPRMQATDTTPYPDSVWLSGNVLEAHGGDELRGDPAIVYRTGPAFAPTHEALSAQQARDHVLAHVGGVRSAWEQRVVDEVLAGVAAWFNGDGNPAPNPTW